MNRRIVPPLLLASLFACAFAVSAQTVTTAVAVDDGGGQAQPAGDATADPAATPRVNRDCLRQTGSRIVARDYVPRSAHERNDRLSQRCVAASGRVYSREDIERTGQVDIADALRMLDPAVY